MRVLYFATSNKGKLVEAQKALEPMKIEVKQLDIAYPEIQASTLEDVARFGMNWLVDKVEHEDIDELIIEDAGLFIHALNNFPGVFSAYVFRTVGLNGILGLMGGKEDRSAHFESCIAYWEEGSQLMFFKGRADGTVVSEPKGEHGFGYDPIFIPDGENRTFAEMQTEDKNRLSHRGKSLKKLVEYLSKG